MRYVTRIWQRDGLDSVAKRARLTLAAVATFAVLVLISNTGQPAMAATFSVTTTTDGGPGSLRQAIIDANASPGADTVNVPAGNYVLTIAGSGEDAAATGDLDITDDLTIVGSGAATTVIDGNALDRVLHVLPDVTAEITGVTITGGVVDASGGGFSPITGGGFLNEGTTVIREVIVDSNEAILGGGVANFGELTVDHSRVHNNASSSPGGGMLVSGPLNMYHTAVDENVGGNQGGGIAIFCGTTVVIEDSTISRNTLGPGGFGGGIFVKRSDCGLVAMDIRLIRTTVDGNVSSLSYGGIRINIDTRSDSFILIDSTVSNNRAVDQAVGGIGGSFTAINSTISGNTAAVAAGGISVESPVKLVNSTVTGNSVTDKPSPDGGGGIARGSVRGDTLELLNTIVAGNFADVGPDINGTVTSLGHNLIGDGTDTSGIVDGVNGDQVGTGVLPIDPLLGPLQDNGGPTFTHALLAGSPAIDAADTIAGPSTDQRGVSRPQGAQSDIAGC